MRFDREPAVWRLAIDPSSKSEKFARKYLLAPPGAKMLYGRTREGEIKSLAEPSRTGVCLQVGEARWKQLPLRRTIHQQCSGEAHRLPAFHCSTQINDVLAIGEFTNNPIQTALAKVFSRQAIDR